MKLRSLAAFGAAALVASNAPAQSAPPAPPPTSAPAPVPVVPPPTTWGSGIAPAPAAGTTPPPASTAAAPPPMSPAPFPVPPPQYPMGYPAGGLPTDGPTALGPDGRLRTLPLEMPYDPDKGMPNGYRIVERRRTTLAIAGAAIFGGLWIPSAIAGGIMEDNGRFNGTEGWPMYIPVFGPFITIDSANASLSGATPLVFLGLGQAAGVVLFAIGMATSDKVLKYQFETAGGVELMPVAGPLDRGGFAGLQGSF